MKSVLFLCLLAFMACEKDIIDIGKCIYKAPLVKELINDAMVAIITKDYSKLLPKIKEALPDLIQIVIGCIIDEQAVEEKPKLEESVPVCKNKCKNQSGFSYLECFQKCRISIKKN